MNWKKRSVYAICSLGILLLAASCGSVLSSEIFNSKFLTETGLIPPGPESATSPDLPNFLLVKATNNTPFPATITIVVNRSSAPQPLNNIVLSPGQTIGNLMDDCSSGTNPVLSVFVPRLGEDNTTNPNLLPFGEVFVAVDNIQVLVAATDLPGVLNVNDHFKCGDTVDFVISSNFTDVNRYMVSALVFSGD